MKTGKKYEITEKERRRRYPIPLAIIDKFLILVDEVGKKMLDNELGITGNSALYLLYSEAGRQTIAYNSRNDDSLLKQKLAGASLFIAQKKREVYLLQQCKKYYEKLSLFTPQKEKEVTMGQIPSFSYNNKFEMDEIEKLDQILYDSSLTNPSPREMLIEEIKNEFYGKKKTERSL